MKKLFRVRAVWAMSKEVNVYAKDEEEAEVLAGKKIDVDNEGFYVPDSFEVHEAILMKDGAKRLESVSRETKGKRK
jgi:hypothetical protein